VNLTIFGGGGVNRSFPRDGERRDSTDTQKSGHATNSGPEVKNRRSSAKDGALKRLRCGTIQKELSLDPAECVRRRCKKNSLSALSCIDKRKREGCDRGSKVGIVYSAARRNSSQRAISLYFVMLSVELV